MRVRKSKQTATETLSNKVGAVPVVVLKDVSGRIQRQFVYRHNRR
jgi:hypothetical protein